MLAGLRDEHDGRVLRAAQGNDITGLDVPSLDDALDGRVPGSVTVLRFPSRHVGEIDKGVGQETGAPLHGIGRTDIEGDDLDGIRKVGR